eukprot:5611897-Prymnesium_polylepis.1
MSVRHTSAFVKSARQRPTSPGPLRRGPECAGSMATAGLRAGFESANSLTRRARARARRQAKGFARATRRRVPSQHPRAHSPSRRHRPPSRASAAEVRPQGPAQTCSETTPPQPHPMQHPVPPSRAQSEPHSVRSSGPSAALPQAA